MTDRAAPATVPCTPECPDVRPPGPDPAAGRCGHARPGWRTTQRPARRLAPRVHPPAVPGRRRRRGRRRAGRAARDRPRLVRRSPAAGHAGRRVPARRHGRARRSWSRPTTRTWRRPGPDIARAGRRAAARSTAASASTPRWRPCTSCGSAGQFTAVPAVSTPDVSRSHFQAQDCLERGGSSAGTAEGWLDRVLDALGPGTTFRGAERRRDRAPASLAGDQPALALQSVEEFTLHAGDAEMHGRTVAGAVRALHRPRPPAGGGRRHHAGGPRRRPAVVTAAGYEAGRAVPRGRVRRAAWPRWPG